MDLIIKEDYEQLKIELEPTPDEADTDEKEVNGISEEPPHVHDASAIYKSQAEAVYQMILDLKDAGHRRSAS